MDELTLTGGGSGLVGLGSMSPSSCSSSSGCSDYTGMMDDVRVWDRALDFPDVQIDANMYEPSSDKANNLKAGLICWRAHARILNPACLVWFLLFFWFFFFKSKSDIRVV